MDEQHAGTDAALVEAARSGDQDALAGIYDRYADPVHDFCTSLLRDRHEAADVMQDTFVTAMQRLAQLREPAKLRAWLFAIARHEALARVRARGRVVPTEEVPEMPGPAVDTPVLAPAEAAVLVQDAAAGLEPDEQAVLDLNVRQGLEGDALAEALGVSPGTARVQLHRVRERFERSVTALLLVRKGRAHCPELAGLVPAGEALSPVVRKRVARHAERCETCATRRRALVAPLAALAAVPAVPAPAEARQMVLDRVRLVSHAVAGDGWRADGFPPGPEPDRAWRVPVVLGVLAFGLVGLLALFAVSDAGSPAPATPPVTEVAPTTAPAELDTTTASSGPRRRSPGGAPDVTITTTTTTMPPTTTTTVAPSTTAPTTTTLAPTTTTVPRIR